MNNRGICTSCGQVVVQPHVCSDDIARLEAIDREAGCGRTVREILLAEGKKGFNNKIETLEAEAIAIRAKG
jgi:hypothetical protein